MSGIVIHQKREFTSDPAPDGQTYSGSFRWFEVDGETYLITGGNAYGGNWGWGYEVVRAGSWETIEDGFMTLADIRKRFAP